jgi:UDP-glucuronate 4-epimerase
MKILVTGAAGFIGFHLTKRLLERGDGVTGLDNLNAYYDPSLKKARLAQLELPGKPGDFEFVHADIADRAAMEQVFGRGKFDVIVNLAAQAGVRYSIENPRAYIDANVVGFMNVLEGARHHGTGHLVYASTSSVYGLNTNLPFKETENTDRPVSLYAATKKANELMAHSYSHLFKVPATGLRFFTVYGPWGRPDMSAYIFTRAILSGKPITVFNGGDMKRDFTYIDDIVAGLIAALDRPPVSSGGVAPHRRYNLGNHRAEELMHFIQTIERATNHKATIEFADMQPGDVKETYADITAAQRDLGFQPKTPIDDGIPRFVAWYREYHGV